MPPSLIAPAKSPSSTPSRELVVKQARSAAFASAGTRHPPLPACDAWPWWPGAALAAAASASRRSSASGCGCGGAVAMPDPIASAPALTAATAAAAAGDGAVNADADAAAGAAVSWRGGSTLNVPCCAVLCGI
eukprot:362861-Chlamydomonas_euryale.AAC.1